MFEKRGLAIVLFGLVISVFAFGGPAHAQGGAQVGTLTCNVAGG